MNPLSKAAKLLLCILIGIVGFILIPAIWIAWQQDIGFKTPGAIFILIIWGTTFVALKAIWKYKK